MIKTSQVISALDNCYENERWDFATLGHPYTHLIDSRINIFRDGGEHWAIAVEVLGYTSRADAITLEITYFGNCLKDLELSVGEPTNSYRVIPADVDIFNETIDLEYLKPEAASWLVRGSIVPLSHNNQDYISAGIKLKKNRQKKIAAEEAGRLVILEHRDLFRATNEELYKSIPPDLDKILVIDEWYHKDFYQQKHVFENPEILSRFDLGIPSVREMVEQELEKNKLSNAEEWNNNRPGSYETWQQIAKVIETGDPSLYKPTQTPNSHWKNWPDSGSM